MVERHERIKEAEQINRFVVIIIIIIIINARKTGPSGKTKVVYKLLSQRHKHLRYGKLKKTQLRETTNA